MKNIGMMNKIKIVLVFMALVSAVGAAGAGMGGIKINGKNDVIRVIYDANMQLNALYVNIERGGYDVDLEKTGVGKKIYAVNKVLMDTRDLIESRNVYDTAEKAESLQDSVNSLLDALYGLNCFTSEKELMKALSNVKTSSKALKRAVRRM